MFPGLHQNRRFGLIWPSGKQDWEEWARWRLISLLMSSSCLFLVIWRELLMLRLNAGTIRRLGSSSPDAPPLIAFWLIGWTEPEAALLKNNSDTFAQPQHHLSWLWALSESWLQEGDCHFLFEIKCRWSQHNWGEPPHVSQMHKDWNPSQVVQKDMVPISEDKTTYKQLSLDHSYHISDLCCEEQLNMSDTGE